MAYLPSAGFTRRQFLKAGAVRNCLAADPSVQLVALGDAFADRIEAALTDFTAGVAGATTLLARRTAPDGLVLIPP